MIIKSLENNDGFNLEENLYKGSLIESKNKEKKKAKVERITKKIYSMF